MAHTMSRSAYADMFGPTTGDRVRLADTELFIEVERDFTSYGEEVKFGGGKVIRDGMGQSQATRAEGAADTVITNALILDHWGVVKADIGIRDGRIQAVGKAGNPDIQDGVEIVIGPGTEAIAGEGRIRHRRRHRLPIFTSFVRSIGGRCAVRRASPPCWAAAPARPTGTNATTCTPGPMAYRADDPASGRRLRR